MSTTRTAVAIGLVVAVVLSTVTLLSIAAGRIAAVDLLVPGGLGPSRDVIIEDFGGIPPNQADRVGYDGQQVYAIARWFPDLVAAQRDLDSPRYRSFRILQSAAVAALPPGMPTVVGLMILGAAGTGLACGAVADLCGRRGRDPRLGLLAVVPLVTGFAFTTVEPLAFGLGFLGLTLADRGRFGWATVAFTLGVLTKEAALVMAVGASIGLLPRGRAAIGMALIPGSVGLLWWTVLGSWVGGGLPDRFRLLGVLEASAPSQLLFLLLIGLAVAGAWGWRDVPAVWPVVVLFGLWALTWDRYIVDWAALPRVSAPASILGLTAVGHWLLSRREHRSGHMPSSRHFNLRHKS